LSSIDVIVPCYRYGHFLPQCVDSVLTQVNVAVRVLVIDDCSPDNSAEVAADLVRRDTRVQLVRHAINRGHIATYNEGLEWASADYVLLLSADDYLLPGALERAAMLMNERPDVGFTFGNAIAQDASGSAHLINTPATPRRGASSRVLSGEGFIRLSGARNIVPTPTAVVQTWLQKRVGGYRAELPHTGDMEMWLRLAACASVGVISASQAVYRRHANNMSDSYRWLLDLQHREAALYSFLADCWHGLADPPNLRRHLLRSLAHEAVGAASAAFNDGQLDLYKALLAYARQANPKVTATWPWTKLAFKRVIGRHAWRALESSLDAITQTVLREKERLT
jgi:hypothetical protein